VCACVCVCVCARVCAVLVRASECTSIAHIQTVLRSAKINTTHAQSVIGLSRQHRAAQHAPGGDAGDGRRTDARASDHMFVSLLRRRNNDRALSSVVLVGLPSLPLPLPLPPPLPPTAATPLAPGLVGAPLLLRAPTPPRGDDPAVTTILDPCNAAGPLLLALLLLMPLLAVLGENSASRSVLSLRRIGADDGPPRCAASGPCVDALSSLAESKDEEEDALAASAMKPS
jgi:hypothetical protein